MKIKIHCERCRYLSKRTTDIEMGPVSSYNMTIAPTFYGTQVDIYGPLKAYSLHKRRITIKIWPVVFCYMTTSATSIKVLEDYSTIAFVPAFTRFAFEVVYTQFMLIDEGSQLVKDCESMRLTFTDIRNELHKDTMVTFDTCPVGGHNYSGKVERTIRHIKELQDKSCRNKSTVYPSMGNSII